MVVMEVVGFAEDGGGDAEGGGIYARGGEI